EKAAEGVYGFKVDLHFSADGRSYTLTRECKPIVESPTGDEDYAVEHFLECDGVVLGPEQTESELGRLLPEQVSRFFLFDGELLQVRRPSQ
ncbi:MAG: hypothetical protein O2797_08985, partial [Bacteroidetes bacterium]|nr:hypothetical protein [Bacteroidota bacterium]